MTGPSDRTAIFGYRLRFAPETQPLRQTVIDSIVLRNVSNLGDADGGTIGKLNEFDFGGATPLVLSLEDTRSALQRLEAAGLVAWRSVRKKQHWNVTSQGRTRIDADATVAETRTSAVLTGILGERGREGRYRGCFLQIIGAVFDALTQRYLEALIASEASPITAESVGPIIDRTLGRFPDVNGAAIRSGVLRFFRESHPDFDWLKWTYCKNYYAVRALGLGPESDVLSREVFEGTTFLLDTNVLINALDDSAPHHAAIKQTIASLKTIGCQVKVLSISVAEFRDLIQTTSANLETVLRQIPDALLERVSGPFGRAEARHRADPKAPSAAEVLAHYESVETLLVAELGVSVHYDEWFDSAPDAEDVIAYARRLKARYDSMPPPWRRKTSAAALHDAMALGYIAVERKANREYLFLTRDTSLVGREHLSPGPSDGTRGLGISLDALMPWLGLATTPDDRVEAALASILATQLLPIGTTFSLHDFRMLAAVDMDCGHMPAEDVEQCLIYLRRHAREIDITKAEGREQIHALVKKFFAAPDRTYLARMSELEATVEQTTAALEEERRERRSNEEAGRLAVSSLESRALRAEAFLRLAAAGVCLILLSAGALWIAEENGEGTNTWQRVGEFWWLFGAAFLIAVGLARVLCKGKRWSAVQSLFSFLGRG